MRLWFKDVDEFQKLASGLGSIIISLIVMAAGGWSFYIFNAELHVENAKAALEKLNRELLREPKVDTDLALEQIRTGDSRKRILVGTLTFRNLGTGSVVLRQLADEAKPSLHVYEVGYVHGHEEWKHLVSFFIPGDKDITIGEIALQSGVVTRGTLRSWCRGQACTW